MQTATAWASPPPGNEAARPLLEAGKWARIHISNNADNDTLQPAQTQLRLSVPRIIATHWLRVEMMEAANG